jgi:hypothetical protein
MAQIAKVQYRDAMRGEWTALIQDGTGYTASAAGVTQVFGQPVGAPETKQLAAFPDEAILGVSFEQAPNQP